MDTKTLQERVERFLNGRPDGFYTYGAILKMWGSHSGRKISQALAMEFDQWGALRHRDGNGRGVRLFVDDVYVRNPLPQPDAGSGKEVDYTAIIAPIVSNIVKQETRDLRREVEVLSARLNRGAVYHRERNPNGIAGWVQEHMEKYFGNICFEEKGLTLSALMNRLHIPVNETSMEQVTKALGKLGYEPMGDFYYFSDPDDQ